MQETERYKETNMYLSIFPKSNIRRTNQETLKVATYKGRMRRKRYEGKQISEYTFMYSFGIWKHVDIQHV